MHTKTPFLISLILIIGPLCSGCGLPFLPEVSEAAPPAEETTPAETWGAAALPASPEPSETSAPAPAPEPEPEPVPESAVESEPVPGSAAEPEEPSAAPQETPDEAEIDALLSGMTLEEKVAQLFVVTPEALTGFDGTVTASGDLTRESFAEIPVGGLVYMGDNLENAAQTREMLSDMREISLDRIGLVPFLCVDEEGGTVARISGSGRFDTREYPDMSDVGETGDPEEARQIGDEMGKYLSDLGFNVDFAPVADVLSNPENGVVKYRAFSSDPKTVAAMTAAFTQGLEAHGVLASYKHFPGHGNTAEDSHLGFAESDADLETLRGRELIPFADGIGNGISMIMAGHISLPEVTDSERPASLSRRVITELLREEMGFDGLVITDALNMGAIADNYTSGEAAVMALEAGVDLLLMPSSFSAAYDAVLEAVSDGTLPEERIDASLRRILRVKLRL